MNLFSVTSIVPFFLIVGIFYFVSSKIFNYYPGYFEDSNLRFPAITGIRSLLALSVFFHHAIIFYYYHQHGRWENPPSNFYTLLGQVAVAIFFSITSFLFWTKAIDNKGKIPFLKFIISRVKRIAPAYIVSAICILILIAINSQFRLNVTIWSFFYEAILFILGLGAVELKTINSLDPGIMGSGIFWTLRYEWKFYFFLPIMALTLKKDSIRHLMTLLVIVYVCIRMITNFESLPHGLLFLPGILAAHFIQNKSELLKKFKKYIMPLGLISLITLFIFCKTIYTFSSFFLLLIFFCSIFYWEHHSNIYKFFTSKTLLILGNASYSTYLFHTIFLYISFSFLNINAPLIYVNPLYFWSSIFLIGGFLLVFSIFSFKFIELSFYKKTIKT